LGVMGRKAKALIIHTNPDSVAQLQDSLLKLGYSVFVTFEKLVGLGHIVMDSPDLVFLDAHLAGVKGMEVVDTIRMSYPELPVVLLTSGTGALDVHPAETTGVCAVFSQPFNLDRVKTLVSIQRR
jgi:DNA-binding response OmpR family regulator